VIRRVLAVAAVVVATLAGGLRGLVAFHQDRTLSVGTIELSVSPGHKGALDVYVPLVDWGARFEAIRLPVRLRVDLQTIDRRAVAGSPGATGSTSRPSGTRRATASRATSGVWSPSWRRSAARSG
jgi:hypothetical protein